MITVYIDCDPSSLGPDATRADLDGYAHNLAAHLAERFACSIEVEPVLGGNRAGQRCPAHEAIDNYVRELEGGDGWLELLPEPEPGLAVLSIPQRDGGVRLLALDADDELAVRDNPALLDAVRPLACLELGADGVERWSWPHGCRNTAAGRAAIREHLDAGGRS